MPSAQYSSLAAAAQAPLVEPQGRFSGELGLCAWADGHPGNCDRSVPCTYAAGPEWYEDQSVSAHDALKLLVNRIQVMGPVSECQGAVGLCGIPPKPRCVHLVRRPHSSSTLPLHNHLRSLP